jgi:glycosyltransferase involved in cell wall biosynthesis
VIHHSLCDVTIIVPSRRWDAFLERCIVECRKLYPDVPIIVLIDDYPQVEKVLPVNVRMEKTSDKTIAGKRNRGVEIAATSFVAFIDSDAYPSEGWLENALGILADSLPKTIVGGPQYCPQGSSAQHLSVRLARRSFFVSGVNTHHYFNCPGQFECAFLPSCNLVMWKSDFELFGGMDVSLVAGEDTVFAINVVRNGGRFLYDYGVSVYHAERNFLKFFIQRYCHGYSVVSCLQEYYGNSGIMVWLVHGGMFLLFLFMILLLWKMSFVFGALFGGLLFLTALTIIMNSIRISSRMELFPLVAIAIVLHLSAYIAGIVCSMLPFTPKPAKIYVH